MPPARWRTCGPTSAHGARGGDGEAWERGPYYVRGLVALAHTLHDDSLVQRARPWLEWTLASQRDDGGFGPAANDDWWARMPMLDALRLHHEATGDARVLPFLLRYFRHQLAALPDRPLDRPVGPDGAERTTPSTRCGRTRAPASRGCSRSSICCTRRPPTGRPSCCAIGRRRSSRSATA